MWAGHGWILPLVKWVHIYLGPWLLVYQFTEISNQMEQNGLVSNFQNKIFILYWVSRSKLEYLGQPAINLKMTFWAQIGNFYQFGFDNICYIKGHLISLIFYWNTGYKKNYSKYAIFHKIELFLLRKNASNIVFHENPTFFPVYFTFSSEIATQ